MPEYLPSEIREDPYNILVIEDDTGSQLLLEDALTSEGYKVTITSNAEDGLERLKEEQYDLILFDIGLPGISGTEFCKRVKSQMGEDAPYLVAATAKDTQKEIEGALLIGAQDYIAKPITAKTLRIRMTVYCFTIERMRKARKYREQIERSEAKLKHLLENSREVVSTLDPRGNFTYISPSIENLLGYRSESLIGTPIQQIVHSDDAYEVNTQNLQEQADGGALEIIRQYRILHQNGKYIWVESLFRVVQDEEEENLKEVLLYSRQIPNWKTFETHIYLLQERLAKISSQNIKDATTEIGYALHAKAFILTQKREELHIYPEPNSTEKKALQFVTETALTSENNPNENRGSTKDTLIIGENFTHLYPKPEEIQDLQWESILCRRIGRVPRQWIILPRKEIIPKQDEEIYKTLLLLATYPLQ